MSPALAWGFFTTDPPGKPQSSPYWLTFLIFMSLSDYKPPEIKGPSPGQWPEHAWPRNPAVWPSHTFLSKLTEGRVSSTGAEEKWPWAFFRDSDPAGDTEHWQVLPMRKLRPPCLSGLIGHAPRNMRYKPRPLQRNALRLLQKGRVLLPQGGWCDFLKP